MIQTYQKFWNPSSRSAEQTAAAAACNPLGHWLSELNPQKDILILFYCLALFLPPSWQVRLSSSFLNKKFAASLSGLSPGVWRSQTVLFTVQQFSSLVLDSRPPHWTERAAGLRGDVVLVLHVTGPVVPALQG